VPRDTKKLNTQLFQNQIRSPKANPPLSTDNTGIDMQKQNPNTETNHRTDVPTRHLGNLSQETVYLKVVNWAGSDGSTASDIGIFQQTAAEDESTTSFNSEFSNLDCHSLVPINQK
jgi:hypothetical protein